MAAKKIIYGHEAMESVRQGVRKLAHASRLRWVLKAGMLLLKKVSGRQW